MAIKTKIARHYALRQLIIGFACLILGAWGLYDYVWTIPGKELAYARLQLLEQSRAGLETEQVANTPSPEAKEAYDAVLAELNALVNKGLTDLQESGQEIKTQQDMQDALANLDITKLETRDGQWFAQLTLISKGLQSERHLPLTEEKFPEAFAAYELVSKIVDKFGAIEKPHKYDRLMKGLVFLPCLPFFPFYMWIYFRTKRRVYELDDDGNLHSPLGEWPANLIAEIDMSKWMAKSIAHVVHSDGTRLMLDDYKHRDLHLIIGAIASRLYPQDWDAQAKLVKSSDSGDGDGDGSLKIEIDSDAKEAKDAATSQIA